LQLNFGTAGTYQMHVRKRKLIYVLVLWLNVLGKILRVYILRFQVIISPVEEGPRENTVIVPTLSWWMEPKFTILMIG
jgi:hypothetical protein